MTHLTDNWVTLEESIRKFVEEGPNGQDLLDEAGREIEASRQVYALRKGTGLNQEDFGKITGLAPEEVDEIEYGNFKDSLDETLAKIIEKVAEWREEQKEPFENELKAFCASALALSCKSSSGD